MPPEAPNPTSLNHETQTATAFAPEDRRRNPKTAFRGKGKPPASTAMQDDSPFLTKFLSYESQVPEL